jgi:chloramphenicol O-acetyltransferase
LVESELHDYEGTSEKLAKIWMPLNEFTAKAMDGLKEGKTQIPVWFDWYQKFNEEGKLEVAVGMQARYASVTGL